MPGIQISDFPDLSTFSGSIYFPVITDESGLNINWKNAKISFADLLAYASGSASASYASTASYVEWINVANKPRLISSSLQFTTADDFQMGNVLMRGGVVSNDFTVMGTLTANEYHSYVTSESIIFASGSTKFGNELIDIHEFTGSVNITGSLSVSGTSNLTASNAISSSYASNASHANLSDYATNASHANNADNAISASHAIISDTASYAINLNPNATASYAITAETASFSNGLTVNGNISSSGIFSASSAYIDHDLFVSGTVTATQYNFLVINTLPPATSSEYQFSGSFSLTGSVDLSGSLSVNGPIYGTASNAISASYALTASYASNVSETASYAIMAATASLLISTASHAVSASYAETASYAANVPQTASFALTSDAVQLQNRIIVNGKAYSGSTAFNDSYLVASASANINNPVVMYVGVSSGSGFGDITLTSDWNPYVSIIGLDDEVSKVGQITGSYNVTMKCSKVSINGIFTSNSQLVAKDCKFTDQILAVNGTSFYDFCLFITNTGNKDCVSNLTGDGAQFTNCKFNPDGSGYSINSTSPKLITMYNDIVKQDINTSQIAVSGTYIINASLTTP